MSSLSPHERHLIEYINDVTLGVSIPGVTLTIILLAAVAYLRRNPVSRPHLDRVSFRLLCYALLANITFGSMMFAPMQATTPGCSVVAFVGITSPLFCSAMCCCMALNLQLVLVFGVNGNKMEKYYIVGSILVCAASTVPPWIAGELGWYAVDASCWLRAPTPEIQLHWLIGSQSIPMLAISTIEVVSFVNLITFMIRHHIRVQRLRADIDCESRIDTLASNLPKHPIVQCRSMILRIALYPLLSCFLSVTACVLDVYSVLNPELTDYNMNLRILDLCVYSFRPLLYALLAATDPSFLRAIHALRSKSSESKSSSRRHYSQSQSQTASTVLDAEGKWSPTTTPETSTACESDHGRRLSEEEKEAAKMEVEVEAKCESESESEEVAHQI
ncbi:hypothetical protein C8R47DRAFT_596318 [Mycena vitilis]|nr:hypothetical protein C8R47DRAFT_596318 [Mycena vitilis]